MADNDEPAPKAEAPAESPEAKSFASEPEPVVKAGRLSFTIDMASGQMVTIEAVDDGGVRRELTAEERSGLANAASRETLDDILERTFEAGITAVLGEDGEDEEVESEDGANLRHLILRPMIARGAAKRFLRREVLSRALIGALIQDAADAHDAPQPEAAAAPTRPAGPSSSSRRATPPAGARH